MKDTVWIQHGCRVYTKGSITPHVEGSMKQSSTAFIDLPTLVQKQPRSEFCLPVSLLSDKYQICWNMMIPTWNALHI